jgi:hypothetical protein
VSRQRPARPATQQNQERRGPNKGLLIGGGIVVVALLAFIVASFSAGGGDSAEGLQETGDVTITGMPLPEVPAAGQDLVLGMTMPGLAGVSFDGSPVEITNDGRAKVLLYMAHW